MQPIEAARTGSFSTVELSKILLIAGQLTLVLLVAAAYELEGDGFIRMLQFALGGFIVHALLPDRLRLPFFSLLSLAAMFVVLGPPIAATVIALGLGLVGLCHLPLPFLAAGAAGACRGHRACVLALRPCSSAVAAGVWPILSSMFMFRVIIYLYDTHHLKQRGNLWQSLGYFFMLPNVCFPLFPVIDYKRYLRNYFNEDRFLTYQRGVKWIFRGVVHLILYRFVYHYIAMDPADVSGLSGVLQFSFGAFLLYLQVSGQFHIIIGVLLLFGFNLPETHNLYYLASSFTDFWRRINIYWKDFVMKIFYYPVHFRVKRFGDTTALIAATIAVFVATWFLHAYQWYWLRARPLWSGTTACSGAYWPCSSSSTRCGRFASADRARSPVAEAAAPGSGQRSAAARWRPSPASACCGGYGRASRSSSGWACGAPPGRLGSSFPL